MKDNNLDFLVQLKEELRKDDVVELVQVLPATWGHGNLDLRGGNGEFGKWGKSTQT